MRRSIAPLILLGWVLPGSSHAGDSTLPSAISIPKGPHLPSSSIPTTIDSAGQAVIDFEIEVPWAPKGAPAPKFGLRYESHSEGDGLLGRGWSLSGFVGVQRIQHEGISTEASPWMLRGVGVGSTLVDTGKGYWRQSVEEDPILIEDIENGPILYDSQGYRYHCDHQVQGEGHIGRWEITRIEDPQAPEASIEIDWTSDHRPSTITKFDHRILFEYEPRDVPVVRNDHGVIEVRDTRISTIRIQHQGEDLWSYRLIYSEGDFLRSIRKEASGIHLPSFEFDYGDFLDTPEAVGDMGLDSSVHLGSPNVVWEDYDQDGDPDLVRTIPGAWEYRRNLGGSFGPWMPQLSSPSWDTFIAGIQFADIDRNGILELLYPTPGGVLIHDHRGNYQRTEPTVLPSSVEIVDFDGDHRVDFVNAPLGIAWLWGDEGLTPISFEPFGVEFFAWRRWVDLNGDGISDLLSQHPESGDLMWAYHRGRGLVEPSETMGWTHGRLLAVGDLDGDRAADFVVQTSYGKAIYHQDGSVWRKIESDPFLPEERVTISDVDADGHPEIVRSGNGWGIWKVASPSTGKLIRSSYGGSSTSFSYARAQDLTSGESFPFGQSVVSSMVYTDPLGEVTTHSYSYIDGLFDAEHASPFGYRIVQETTDASRHVEAGWRSSEYEDAWPLRGHVRVEETPAVLEENVWEVASGKILKTEVFRLVRGQASSMSYDYDAWGNPIAQTSQGALDIEGDELNVTRIYREPLDWRGPKDRILQETKDGRDRRVSFWSYEDDFNPAIQGEGEEIRAWMSYEEGLPTSFEDGEGTLLSFTYDDFGHLREERYEDGEGNVIRYSASFDVSLGLPVEVTTPSGVVHTIRYDAIGRPLESSRNGHREASYQYHDLNDCSIVETKGSLSHTITWLSLRGETYQMAERSRDGWSLRQSRYEQGKLVESTYPTYLDRIEYSCDRFVNDSYSTETWYSSVGEPLRVATPGSVTHYSYAEGKTSKWTDDDVLRGSSGIVTYYDGQNQEIRIDYYGDSYSYEWASDGKVFAVEDPLGHRRQYMYDLGGNLRALQDPDAGDIHYDYDARANLIRATTPDETVDYIYDGFGRLILILSGDHEIHRLEYNDRGLVSHYTDQEAGTLDLEYDDFGRIFLKRRRIDDYDLRVQYNYDGENNVSRVAVPTEAVYVDLIWDGAHRLLAVDGYISDIHYTPAGDWNSLTLASGLTITREFDMKGFETERRASDWYLRTRYDARHNTIERSTPLHQENFGYDARSQMVSWKHGPETISMTYASDGTRLSFGDTSESVLGSHRLRGASYTPGGKIWEKDGIQYFYDGLGRVVEIRKGGRSEHYRYDYSHRPYQSWTTDDDGVIMQHRVHEDPLEVRDGEMLFWIPGPLPIAQPLD